MSCELYLHRALYSSLKHAGRQLAVMLKKVFEGIPISEIKPEWSKSGVTFDLVKSKESGLQIPQDLLDDAGNDIINTLGGSTNGSFADGTSSGHGPKSEYIEVLYNYFQHDDGRYIDFNRHNDQGTTWVYRNTFACELRMTNLSNGDHDGPWVINDNVLQNSFSGISYHYTCSGDYMSAVSQSGNVGSRSGVVDSSGRMTAGYSSHVGATGWQFSDGSTPMDGGYTPVLPPMNLKIVAKDQGLAMNPDSPKGEKPRFLSNLQNVSIISCLRLNISRRYLIKIYNVPEVFHEIWCVLRRQVYLFR